MLGKGQRAPRNVFQIFFLFLLRSKKGFSLFLAKFPPGPLHKPPSDRLSLKRTSMAHKWGHH